MIVVIDGPAGSGKSTTAREVARRLGFRHLESGAFYRALTRAALDHAIPVAAWDALTLADLDGFGVHARPAAEGFHLYAGAQDVTERLRTPEVDAHVSRMARIPAVREWLLSRLRDAAHDVDLVAEGRDMGTVVFPYADVKVFLTASPLARARRRLAERGDALPDADALEAESDRLRARDRQDSERAVAPLRKAPGATELDTSALTFEEQVERVVSLVRQARA